MRLKIYDSHLTCRDANKCLNVRERVEVLEWNKRWSPSFPYCPVTSVSVKEIPDRKKVTINENVCFTDYTSGIRLSDCSKLTVNWKNENDVTIFWHDVICWFFWRRFVSHVKFSYWSMFHVKTITGSGVIKISIYKELTRNPEIGNTPVWVLPNIWRLGQVRNTEFGTNVSNKKLPNAARKNNMGGKAVKLPHPPPPRHTHTQIRFKGSISK